MQHSDNYDSTKLDGIRTVKEQNQLGLVHKDYFEEPNEPAFNPILHLLQIPLTSRWYKDVIRTDNSLKMFSHSSKTGGAQLRVRSNSSVSAYQSRQNNFSTKSIYDKNPYGVSP